MGATVIGFTERAVCACRCVQVERPPLRCGTRVFGAGVAVQLAPSQEAELSNVLFAHVGDAKAGIAQPPKLLGWDHNWSEWSSAGCVPTELTTYPEELLSVPNHVDALGYHSYCGEATL